MKKAAFFVEGQTELIFLRKILEEVAGAHNISFIEQRRHAGSIIELSSTAPPQADYFALLIDCAGDASVLSFILDRYEGLVSSGYELIIGLRDLYPVSHSNVGVLRSEISRLLPTTHPIPEIIFAVHEIEAWFINEDTHFLRISHFCTPAAILQAISYDTNTGDPDALINPAKKLNQIYKIGNKAYTKRKKNVLRTVAALDFAHLYCSRRSFSNSFDAFITLIDCFLRRDAQFSSSDK